MKKIQFSVAVPTEIPQRFSCGRREMATEECPDDKFVPVDCSTIQLKTD